MKIGQILIEASVINARQLQEGLDYAASKAIPVGRALRTLNHLREEDLNRGLDAQQAIVRGLDRSTAVMVVKYAIHVNRTFMEALRAWPGGRDKIPAELMQKLTESGLEHTRVGQRPSGRVKVSTSADASWNQSAQKPAQQPAYKAPVAPPPVSAPAKPSLSFDELIKEGDELFAVNRCVAAEKSYLMAKRELEPLQFSPPSKVSKVLSKLASLYLATDRCSEAEPLYVNLLQVQSSAFGRKSPEVALIHEHLGDLHVRLRRLSDAEGAFEQSLFLLQQIQPFDITSAGRLLKKMDVPAEGDKQAQGSRTGELAVAAGLVPEDKMQAALQLSKEAGQPIGIALRKKFLLDTQQVESVLFAQLLVARGILSTKAAARAIKLASHNKLALRQLADAGKWMPDAEASDERFKLLVVEQEKLIAAESSLGCDHPEVLAIVERIADLYIARKERSYAEHLYTRVINVFKRSDNVDLASLARLCEKLAESLCYDGKLLEAQALLLKSLEYRQSAGESNSVQIAKCLWLIAKIELSQTNYSTSLSFLRSAKAMFEKLAPGFCPKRLLEEMVACAKAGSSPDDLELALTELIRMAESQNDQSQTTADYLEQLGDLYAAAGRREEAHVRYAAASKIIAGTATMQEKEQMLSTKLAKLTS